MQNQIEIFRAAILGEAAQQRDDKLQELKTKHDAEMAAAEETMRAEISAEALQKEKAAASAHGQEISRSLLAYKQDIAKRREEIADEVFAAVEARLEEYTKTNRYLPHLRHLLAEALLALGNPEEVTVLLREEDMHYKDDLIDASDECILHFSTDDIRLGGMIVVSHNRNLRADQTFDTALSDMDGHFAELFGLSLSEEEGGSNAESGV